MSVNHSVYLETDLSHEQILKIFVELNDPNLTINIGKNGAVVVQYIETERYHITAMSPLNYHREDAKDYGIDPTVYLDFYYMDENIVTNIHYSKILLAQFTKKIDDDMLVEFDYPILLRKSKSLSIRGDDWTPELREYLHSPYAIVNEILKVPEQ